MDPQTVNLTLSTSGVVPVSVSAYNANTLILSCDGDLSSGTFEELTAEIYQNANLGEDPLATVTYAGALGAGPHLLTFVPEQTNLLPSAPSILSRSFYLVVRGTGTGGVKTVFALGRLTLYANPASDIGAPPPAPSLYASNVFRYVAAVGSTSITASGRDDTLNVSATGAGSVSLNPTTKTITLRMYGGAAWSAGIAYAVGAVVSRGTSIYVSTLAHTSSSTTEPGVGASWATAWAIVSGAQADWSASSGPSAILNKPTLGDSASRNVGTSAGTVAAGDHGHTTSQVTGLDTALGLKADLVGGKLSTSQLPDLAIVQYLGAAANQAAMLALVGQRGDWCTRTDEGKTYILTAEPSSTLANWTAMAYPASPVVSVAGRTGIITLGIGDIGGLQGALDAKADAGALLALAFRDTVGSAQIESGAVTNAKLDSMAVNTVKGSIAGGVPVDLTQAQLTSLINTFTASVSGAVPAASGGNLTTEFLRKDGTWAAPPGGVGGSPAGSDGQLQFNNSGAFGAVSGSSTPGGVITSSVGSALVNPTVALSGQAFSAPIMRWQSSAFAGGVSKTMEWRVVANTSVGSANPTASLGFELSINGGGWTRGFTIQGGENGSLVSSINKGTFGQVEAVASLFAENVSFIVSSAQEGACLRSSWMYSWANGTSGSGTRDLFLGRRAAANLRLGAADAAAPVAQTLSVQSVVAGTASGAVGANFTINGSQGTGTGVGGDIIFRVAPAGSASTAQNPLSEAIRVRASDKALVASGAIISGGVVDLAIYTVSVGLPTASLWAGGIIYVSDANGGAGVMASDGTSWRKLGQSRSLPPFLPINAQLPAANFATRDTTNATTPVDVLDFIDGTARYAAWTSVIPENFDMTSGLKVRLTWKLDTATPSGNVVWAAQIERMNTDLTADSWDTNVFTAVGTANGTAGIVTTTEITMTTVDGLLSGEPFRIRIYRDGANASDTASFDAELVIMEIRGN